MPRTDLDCAETAPESCWLVCWSTNNVGKTTMIIINGWFKQSIWDISILDVPCHRKKRLFKRAIWEMVDTTYKNGETIGMVLGLFYPQNSFGYSVPPLGLLPQFPTKTNQPTISAASGESHAHRARSWNGHRDEAWSSATPWRRAVLKLWQANLGLF